MADHADCRLPICGDGMVTRGPGRRNVTTATPPVSGCDDSCQGRSAGCAGEPSVGSQTAGNNSSTRARIAMTATATPSMPTACRATRDLSTDEVCGRRPSSIGQTEQCDDGNVIDADGCRLMTTCVVEACERQLLCSKAKNATMATMVRRRRLPERLASLPVCGDGYRLRHRLGEVRRSVQVEWSDGDGCQA